MKYLVLILAPFASGFLIQPLATRPTLSLLSSADGFDVSAIHVDMNRAKECAEKFGKCSVKEVKNLRDCK